MIIWRTNDEQRLADIRHPLYGRGGAYGWIIKHVANNDIHPSADKFVPNRVCDERSARIEQKVDGLKETVTREFSEVKNLIRNNGH